MKYSILNNRPTKVTVNSVSVLLASEQRGNCAFPESYEKNVISKFKMKEILWRLDLLCIEVISIHIERYSLTPRKSWRHKYVKNLGERLIQASLANSRGQGIDENAYSFILNNFHIKKFKIFKKMYEKVNNFNFLNGKYFDELEIDLAGILKLQNSPEHFELNVNKLILNEVEIDNFFHENFTFLSNVYVKSNLEIFLFDEESKKKEEIENLLLRMLNNTSKDIENIFIFYDNPSKSFIERSIDIIIERRNLKYLNIKFSNQQIKSIISLIIVNLINKDSSKCFSSFSNMEAFDRYLKSLDSIEKIIYLILEQISLEEVHKQIMYLQLLKLNNLKELDIHMVNLNGLSNELYHLFEKCTALQRLSVSIKPSVRHSDFNIFSALLPCAKSLKVLYLKNIVFDNNSIMQSFKDFMFQASLKKIKFEFVQFGESYFNKPIELLGNLENSLTSLVMTEIDYFDESKNLLPSVLPKLKKLEVFHLGLSNIENKLLSEILISLQSLSRTLKKIHIYAQEDWRDNEMFEEFDNHYHLFDFLNKCNCLTVIDICININEDKIPQLLQILEKFQSNLEEIDLGFCWNKNYQKEFIEFLTGCPKLKKVYGYCYLDKLTRMKKVVRSLENSRYSLESIDFIYDFLMTRFPLITYN